MKPVNEMMSMQCYEEWRALEDQMYWQRKLIAQRRKFAQWQSGGLWGWLRRMFT